MAALSRPTAARFSWMRSATSTPIPNPNCCACSRRRCIQRLGGDATIPVDVAGAGGDASRPGNRHQGKGVSRGFVLPPERRHDPPAGPERAGGRHPGPGQVFHSPLRQGSSAWKPPRFSPRRFRLPAKSSPGPATSGNWKMSCVRRCCWPGPLPSAWSTCDRFWPKPTSRRRSPSQTHAAYVADLLARVQRGEEHNAYLKMIADLEPELFTQAIRLAAGQPGQSRPLAGRHPAQDARETDPARPAPCSGQRGHISTRTPLTHLRGSEENGHRRVLRL